MKHLLVLAGLTLTPALLQPLTAVAQTYPSAQIRIVAPFPPGGGTDILARTIAQGLQQSWGQPSFVDNRAGANGAIGTAYVAKAAADGHTLLIGPGGFVVNHLIIKGLSYHPLTDFAPVTQLAQSPLVLSIHPSFPPRTIKELITLLKARPDEVNFGIPGVGGPPHLAAELFKQMSGTRMVSVPYKGAGPAAVDLLAGQIQMYFMNALQVVPYVRAGRMRALGVTSKARIAALSEVPTIAEAGLPGYEFIHWYGMWAPAGTPQATISKLNAEMARMLRLPELEKRLASEGATVVASSPAEFATFLKVETEKAARIIKAAGMGVK